MTNWMVWCSMMDQKNQASQRGDWDQARLWLEREHAVLEGVIEKVDDGQDSEEVWESEYHASY